MKLTPIPLIAFKLLKTKKTQIIATAAGVALGVAIFIFSSSCAREYDVIIFRFISVSILLVAGFGIFNILNMMIFEKMKDISIIKAIGFSDSDVRMIFMIQSMTIGIVGAIGGLLLGLLLSWIATLLPFDSDVADRIPMTFNGLYYILGLMFGMLTTALAGYLPSLKAARLNPVTILRG